MVNWINNQFRGDEEPFDLPVPKNEYECEDFISFASKVKNLLENKVPAGSLTKAAWEAFSMIQRIEIYDPEGVYLDADLINNIKLWNFQTHILDTLTLFKSKINSASEENEDFVISNRNKFKREYLGYTENYLKKLLEWYEAETGEPYLEG